MRYELITRTRTIELDGAHRVHVLGAHPEGYQGTRVADLGRLIAANAARDCSTLVAFMGAILTVRPIASNEGVIQPPINAIVVERSDQAWWRAKGRP